MKQKGKGKSIRWGIVVLLLAPVVYIGVQLALILFGQVNRSYDTQTAVFYEMADTLSCQGYVSLNETDITYDGTGVLGYIAQDGERVSAGTAVAQQFSDAQQVSAYQQIQMLNEEIELVEKSQTVSSVTVNVDALLKQTKTGIYEILADVQSGNYMDVPDAREEILTAQNRLLINTGAVSDFSQRIQDLTAQRDAISVENPSSIMANTAGYFVSAQDSTKCVYTGGELSAMSPVEFAQACQQPLEENDSNVAGKIITDYEWRYFALVDAKQAAKFVEGKSVQISFPGVSDNSFPAEVISVTVDEANNAAKVELSCDYINEDVVMLEKESALITFQVYEGLRVDAAARRVSEGEDYVYIKRGNTAQKRYIDVIFEDQNYILVSPGSEDTSEKTYLKMFDEVITDAGSLSEDKVLL